MTTKEFASRYIRKIKPTIFDSGVAARLPDAYRKFYDEWRNTPAKPVHYIPYEGKGWERDEVTSEMKRVEDIPLPYRYPKELEDVFTGGEGVIQGCKKKDDKYSSRVPKFWVPVVYRSVLYSEVLNKYLSALMTKRVVELIHYHRGLDNYLLQTKACDLKTVIALKLKQRILLSLSNGNLPYDEEKNKAVFQKYEKYLIPPEEIEWYGLTFTEACLKQKKIEEEQQKASIIPLKHTFRTELIQALKNYNPENENLEKKKNKSTQWLQKVPGLNKITKGT